MECRVEIKLLTTDLMKKMCRNLVWIYLQASILLNLNLNTQKLETNSTVELFIYDLDSNKTIKANINSEEEFYIPRIKWTLDENILSVQRMNRHQINWTLF